MFIADGHCDALLRLWQSSENKFESDTDVNGRSLQEGEVSAQVFAIFDPVWGERDDGFSIILRQIDQFYEQVTKHPQIEYRPGDLLEDQGKTRAILALEGADALANDWMKWRLLKRLGVESVGLTWNEGNALASGCLEENGSKLSNQGRAVVDWLKEEKMILDGAHLHEDSFFEAAERSGSFFVSHANVANIHPHPRNLTDEQLRVIKRKDGLIGLTFFPKFINGTDVAEYEDLGRQIEHIASVIGPEYIGFGSDFDGIPSAVSGLEGPEKLPSFIEWLLQRYKEEDVKKWSGENFKRFYNNHVRA